MAVLFGYTDNLLIYIPLELLGRITYLHIATPLEDNARIFA